MTRGVTSLYGVAATTHRIGDAGGSGVGVRASGFGDWKYVCRIARVVVSSIGRGTRRGLAAVGSKRRKGRDRARDAPSLIVVGVAGRADGAGGLIVRPDQRRAERTEDH